MSGIVRLFVGNVPHTAGKEDIRSLVSKICPVHDVYIPPKTITGLVRSFAIVEINSDMKDLRKCLQLLNNTNWKGSRLRMEVARPYFVDRLQKERLAEAESQVEDTPDDGHADAVIEDDADKEMPVDVPPVLKIKKSMSETITVHTIPLTTKEKEPEPEPNRRNVFNKKIKYKPRGPGRALRFFFDEDGAVVAPVPDAVEPAAPASAPVEQPQAAAPTAAIITKPLGGGAKQRMGFGFAKEQPRDDDRMACVQDPVAQKWHNKTVGGLSLDDGRFQDRFKGGEHAALDDYYEFAELWEAPPERVEDDDEPEGPVVPAVAEGEVTAEYLEAERNRLLSTLHLLSKGGSSEGGNAAEGVERPPPKAVRRAAGGEGWGSAIVARYDPLAAGAETFHADKQKAAGGAPKQDIDLNFDSINEPSESFANLTVLKDIFHAEEMPTGMQNSAEDALFLETEKLALNTGVSNDASAGMTFNFFGGPSQEENTLPAGLLGGVSVSSDVKRGSRAFEADDQYAENVSPNLPALEDISFVNIVKGAVLFRREKTEDEIHANWLDTRDKLGLAYKKKRREARKKKANVSTAVKNLTDPTARKRKPDFGSKKKGAKRFKR